MSKKLQIKFDLEFFVSEKLNFVIPAKAGINGCFSSFLRYVSSMVFYTSIDSCLRRNDTL